MEQDFSINNPGFLRPVFINKETQAAYDAANPVQGESQVYSAPEAIQPEQVATNNQSQGVEFSPYLKDFYGSQRSYKPSFGQVESTAPSFPTGIYKNLNTNFKGLGSLTTGFGDTTRYEKFHPAIDIANKIGTPIPAFTPGTVVSVSTGKKQGDKGYGNSVIVVDADGNKHRYSHLHKVFVKVGQKVGSGQQLATMGNTGSTYSPSGKGTGSHLDYRIVDAYNKAVNPYDLLKKST